MYLRVIDDSKMRADEEKDRENRSHNIILFRVPEVDAIEERAKGDKSFCVELLNSVLEVDAHENDFKCFRLGKREQTNRPLLLQFREKTLKNRVMECLHKLKSADAKFRDISITHDYTLNERAECKILVEEAKKSKARRGGNTCGW